MMNDHVHVPDSGLLYRRAARRAAYRTVGRVLAAGGTTVPRLVRSRRLECAYALLAGSGPAGNGRAVAEAAGTTGRRPQSGHA
jgi:hypothetical protein